MAKHCSSKTGNDTTAQRDGIFKWSRRRYLLFLFLGYRAKHQFVTIFIDGELADSIGDLSVLSGDVISIGAADCNQ